MRLVRILNARWFNWDKGRFQSSSFRKMGSGVSVFDRDCVADNYGTTICGHIRIFYSIVAAEPIVYWQFDSSVLSKTAILVNIISSTCDICHYDIENLPNKESRDIFRKHALNSNLIICNNDGEEQFSVEKFKNSLN